MASKIILKQSTVPGKVPEVTDLDFGELAINPADGFLYLKKTNGVVIAISSLTPTSALSNVLEVDGAGSTLDADLLDGNDSTYYLNYNNLTNKPTSLPPASHSHGNLDITDVSWSKLTNLPTSVSGYGITDAYTKAETDTNVSTAVSNLVASAPETLNTLNELATALGNDPNFATSIATSIGTKVASNEAIVAGTATKITYDAKGLVTAGSSLIASDIPSLDWVKIATGKPTTISGYGITDAYTKAETDAKFVPILI